jgi:hypothetical protein
MRCKDHPKFAANRKPAKTMRFPDGCPTCWGVWEHAKTDKNRLATTVNVELTVEEARAAVVALARLQIPTSVRALVVALARAVRDTT